MNNRNQHRIICLFLFFILLITSTISLAQTDQTGPGNGTASASSEVEGMGAANAFDNSAGTAWVADSDEIPPALAWIKWDFGAGNEKIITSYSLELPGIGMKKGGVLFIVSWTLYGIPDGGGSVFLDQKIGVSFGSGAQTYSLTTTTAFRSYQFDNISMGGINGMALDFEPTFAEIQLIGTSTPEMNLKNGGDIPNHGTYDFGNHYIDTDKDKVFTIENDGGASLVITQPLTMSGVNSNQFSIQQQPGTTTIPPDGSTTFTIRFGPSSTGTKTAEIRIFNNDSNENPYNLNVTGTGHQAIAPINDKTWNEDVTLADIPVTLDLVGGGPPNLNGYSNNQALVPDANLIFGGSGNNRTLTIVPLSDANGRGNIEIVVNDGVTISHTSFGITVEPVNDAPIVTNMNQVLSYVEGATSVDPDNIVITDIDFAGSVVPTAMGPVTIPNNDESITVNLTLNNTTTGNMTANSGNGETYGQATGVWTVTGNLGQVNAALAAVAFVPYTNNDVNTTVTVHVEDAAGTGPADGTIELNVTPVNDAPTISDIPNMTTNEDTPVSGSFTVSDVETPPDQLILTGTSGNTTLVPDENIVFSGGSLLSSLARSVSTTQDSNRTVTITPASGQSGTTTITVTVSDGEIAVSDTFLLTVGAVNDPPVISGLPDVTFNEDESTTLQLDQFVQDADHDSSQINWSAAILGGESTSSLDKTSSQPKNVTITIDGSTRIATFQSAQNFFGSGIQAVFTATDPGGLTDKDTITVNVLPVNDPPQFLIPLPPVELIQGQHYAIPIILLWAIVEDVDDPDSTLTWSIEESAHITGGVNDDSVWAQAGTDWTGTETLTITVSDGELSDSTPLVVTIVAPAGIEDRGRIPTDFVLYPNRPNPFNPVTTFSYALPKRTQVILTIYNNNGQALQVLEDGIKEAGVHSIQWDASLMSSGIYIYQIRTPEFTAVKKCILMK